MPTSPKSCPDIVTFTSLVALTQTALGCGLGLLIAGKLQRKSQKATAAAMLSVGALATLPIIVDVVRRVWHGPETARGMQRRLESIRRDSGFPQDAEIY